MTGGHHLVLTERRWVISFCLRESQRVSKSASCVQNFLKLSDREVEKLDQFNSKDIYPSDLQLSKGYIHVIRCGAKALNSNSTLVETVIILAIWRVERIIRCLARAEKF